MNEFSNTVIVGVTSFDEEELKTVELCKLKYSQKISDGANKGIYVIVRTIKRSFDFQHSLVIAEDENGDAIRLAIYSDSGKDLPKGSYLIVKEPNFKEARDGLPVVETVEVVDAEKLFARKKIVAKN